MTVDDPLGARFPRGGPTIALPVTAACSEHPDRVIHDNTVNATIFIVLRSSVAQSDSTRKRPTKDRLVVLEPSSSAMVSVGTPIRPWNCAGCLRRGAPWVHSTPNAPEHQSASRGRGV